MSDVGKTLPRLNRLLRQIDLGAIEKIVGEPIYSPRVNIDYDEPNILWRFAIWVPVMDKGDIGFQWQVTCNWVLCANDQEVLDLMNEQIQRKVKELWEARRKKMEAYHVKKPGPPPNLTEDLVYQLTDNLPPNETITFSTKDGSLGVVREQKRDSGVLQLVRRFRPNFPRNYYDDGLPHLASHLADMAVRLRMQPDPPPKESPTLRPWKLGEVPLRAEFRIGEDLYDIHHVRDGRFDMRGPDGHDVLRAPEQLLAEGWQYRFGDECNCYHECECWLPCGVADDK